MSAVEPRAAARPGPAVEPGPVVDWYRRHARDLPWRRPGTGPYAVLVCEVMSQQTPVARVEPVWREWMRRWPDPAALAAAPTAQVLRVWGRLGYPRRALRLIVRLLRVVNHLDAAIDAHPAHHELHMTAARLHLLHMRIRHLRAEMQANHHRLFIDRVGIDCQHRISDVLATEYQIFRQHDSIHYRKIAGWLE